MKVILKKDVAGQGRRGDVLDVNDGYARNFLIAKGFADAATQGGLAEVKRQKDELAATAAEEKKQALAFRDALNKTTVKIGVKCGENTGKIFGSVTSKEIADALEKQGFAVDKKKIVLKEPIKHTGLFEVEIKVFPEMHAKIKIDVSAE